jgi:hypothetical protein
MPTSRRASVQAAASDDRVDHQTFKGQLDLERHGGRTPAGVIWRVLAKILALTTAIWPNDKTGQSIKRSLTPYDH